MDKRCPWCEGDPLMAAYHDLEWGKPAQGDQTHFEFLVLESAQAGLSWRTILHRREHYRKEYAGFDAETVARYGEADIERLMGSGIIRYRKKIEASIVNAQKFLEIQGEFGSFGAYLKSFGGMLGPAPKVLADIPAKTELSDRVAADLKKRGFKFLGSTTIYAHLQAVGIVNDHLESCPFR